MQKVMWIYNTYWHFSVCQWSCNLNMLGIWILIFLFYFVYRSISLPSSLAYIRWKANEMASWLSIVIPATSYMRDCWSVLCRRVTVSPRANITFGFAVNNLIMMCNATINLTYGLGSAILNGLCIFFCLLTADWNVSETHLHLSRVISLESLEQNYINIRSTVSYSLVMAPLGW